jgi:hypothetical protein
MRNKRKYRERGGRMVRKGDESERKGIILNKLRYDDAG